MRSPPARETACPAAELATANVNAKVARLAFQPITVLANGQQFVGQGVLRTVLDDFTYDPLVAANTPPQLTGVLASSLCFVDRCCPQAARDHAPLLPKSA